MSSSPKTEVICIGGGEHARVVMEAVRTMPGLSLRGFIDPQPCLETVRGLDVTRLAARDQEAEAETLRAHVAGGGKLVVGVGAVAGRPDVRASIVDRLGLRADAFATIVHARAWVSPSAALGAGVIVMAGCVVNARADLGAFTVVNTGAIVEHDVQSGVWSQLGPASVVGGGTVIGEHAYVGLGARVRDHVRIGARAVVGMGAVVVGDIDGGSVVVGVPARRVP